MPNITAPVSASEVLRSITTLIDAACERPVVMPIIAGGGPCDAEPPRPKPRVSQTTTDKMTDHVVRE
jgi:hypothetical protein